MYVLQSYENASGQKINLGKSQLSFSRNVLSIIVDELTQLMGVKEVESYEKYLGLPTIIGKSKTQVFNFVKEKVWKKLKVWKERALSSAIRKVLIKAIVQATPSYIMIFSHHSSPSLPPHTLPQCRPFHISSPPFFFLSHPSTIPFRGWLAKFPRNNTTKQVESC